MAMTIDYLDSVQVVIDVGGTMRKTAQDMYNIQYVSIDPNDVEEYGEWTMKGMMRNRAGTRLCKKVVCRRAARVFACVGGYLCRIKVVSDVVDNRQDVRERMNGWSLDDGARVLTLCSPGGMSR